MNIPVDFIENNLIWVGVAAVSGSMLLTDLIKNKGQNEGLSPTETTLKMNRSNAIVVDLRSEDEFSKGHIVGARNIPAAKISENLKEIEKFQSDPIILVCQSGSTASGQIKTLRKAGFENVFHLKGGMPAWQNANLPLEQNKPSNNRKT